MSMRITLFWLRPLSPLPQTLNMHLPPPFMTTAHLTHPPTPLPCHLSPPPTHLFSNRLQAPNFSALPNLTLAPLTPRYTTCHKNLAPITISESRVSPSDAGSPFKSPSFPSILSFTMASPSPPSLSLSKLRKSAHHATSFKWSSQCFRFIGLFSCHRTEHFLPPVPVAHVDIAPPTSHVFSFNYTRYHETSRTSSHTYLPA